MLSRSFFFASFTLVFSNAALAGSVLSTNLPAHTWIVNVDGRNDGAGAYDGGQANWYQPFAVNGILNSITLDPGTYSFDLIDPSDAHSAFPLLDSGQLATIGSGWTYNTPWITDYFVFDSSAANDPRQSQLFSGSNNLVSYGSGEAAYSGAKATGFSNRLMTGPGGRYSGTPAYSYTLMKRQSLIFVVPDYYLGDNNGGVSIVVTQSVPEPTPMAGLAVLGFTVLARRRKSAAS